MKELPLNALRAFALTVAADGVRAAARELGVSHSAVSRHLLELEKWLGAALFERPGSHSGLTATVQARQLARALIKALKDMDTAVEALRERRSDFAVTIGAAPSVANRWLLPRLPRLERAHPRIEVSVLVDQRVLDLRDAGCDLTIRMGQGPWSGVEATPLMDDTLYPVMSPKFWEKAGRPSELGQLPHIRLLHDRDPNAGWLAWRARFGPPDLDVRRGLRFGSSDLTLRAATQGLGVALARGRLAEEDLRTGTLIRPFGDRAVTLKDAYWIVTPLGRQRSAVSQVAAWLRREASRPQDRS
jgi:LysR family transcriptional regulator, glycine cleavage system transcriptional activator